MNTYALEQIERRTAEVRALILEREALAHEHPDDFGGRLALSSLRSHLEDLLRQHLTLTLQALSDKTASGA